MSRNFDRLTSNKPPLFRPTTAKHIREGAMADGKFVLEDGSLFDDTSMGLTSSFKYNIQETGLRSTQQLNIDWAVFENHTFFNSAQVKTNVAFDKIVNAYPWDGKKKEVELFFDQLTGFEKYVYDEMPKQKGYLFFSGSADPGDSGTVVTVKDYAGSQFFDLSSRTDGATSLEPFNSSMTVEMYLYVPSQSLGDLSQYVLHKAATGGNQGLGVTVETLTGSNTADVSFMVVSGATANLEDKVTLNVEYDTWSHVAWIWDRTPGVDTITGYLDTEAMASSSIPFTSDQLGTAGNDLLIGSGSNLGTFIPTTTFSGALDEVRIWHDVRTLDELKEHQKKLVWPDDDLKLYYKLNEPSGSNTNVVLDYSGQSLHGVLNTRGLVLEVRDTPTGSLVGESPMTHEDLGLSVVLFPNVEDTVDLRSRLLVSASNFDNENPNLISKLIPPHYLEEGQCFDGLNTVEGTITDSNVNGDNPGQNNLGDTQALLSMMYTWAKFFDEMKLYTQAFSSLNKLDYDSEDTLPSDFLSMYARAEGLELPPLFVGADINQYLEGENLEASISKNIYGMQEVQNEIWKRMLINMRSVVRSKGTLHSIKSFIRSMGINPDNTFRIREFGGPTRSAMEFSREERFEVSTALTFVSGGTTTSTALSSSATRVESGWPLPGAVSADDNMFTSGSFTIEGTYRFPLNIPLVSNSQSLARLKLTGSNESDGSTFLNLVAVTGSTPTVAMYANPISGSTHVEAVISGANIFDGELWYISCGRKRNDDSDLATNVSSSYFLNVAKSKNGEIVESYTTASYMLDAGGVFQTMPSGDDGPYMQIGSSSLDAPAGVGTAYLEQSGIPDDAKTVAFEGRVSQIRFWSKGLSTSEWKEHTRNYRSVGVDDPKSNFNFVQQNVSGAWERLRMDASTDQITLDADSAGAIELTDFTQNNLTMAGINFPAGTNVIQPEHFYFSYLSPKIDEGVGAKKVRARGLQDADKVAVSTWAETSPVHRVNPFLEVTDSTKLSIDFSIVDALDQDIITIFSSLDEMSDALGRPELQFASDYKDLEVLRDIYFNKLESKMNLKGFFEFYKWFDSNIGTFVEQLMPKNANFLGTNFVIESHFLERAKVQYKFEDIYLGEDIRSGLKDRILLQLITGRIDRF